MACLRAVKESSEESTKIPGTPRRASCTARSRKTSRAGTASGNLPEILQSATGGCSPGPAEAARGNTGSIASYYNCSGSWRRSPGKTNQTPHNLICL